MISQRTLKQSVHGSGVGLHSGREACFAIHPAAPGSGLVFVRSDLPAKPRVLARPDQVSQTRLATTLGTDECRIGTVEHLLAALYGLGVDNARIEVEGDEIPVLDGSAEPFARLILEAGFHEQQAPKKFLIIKRPVSVEVDGRSVRLEPCRTLEIDLEIDFQHPLASEQRYVFRPSDDAFLREIAPARTFGFAREVAAMHAAGLALGGSLDNAVVIDDFSVQNPEGLRFPDEFVRHKILDALGDLALLGATLIGRYVGHKSGHSLNVDLMRRLIATPKSFELAEFEQAEDAEVRELELPVLGLAVA